MRSLRRSSVEQAPPVIEPAASPAAPRSRLGSRRTRPHGSVARWERLAALLLVFVLALGLRLHATALLPTDYDEDDYLRAAQIYAQHLAAGDLRGIINERDNYEHPPLTKLLYGGVLLLTGPASYTHPVVVMPSNQNGGPEIARQARPLRLLSASVGALTAVLVATVSPLAGLLVAINSWHIKYTSEAMLESVACFFATLTFVCLSRSRRTGDRFYWYAAVALGLTAANKYLYAVGGVAAVLWLYRREGRTSWQVLPWCGVALLTFYLFDPALWPAPIAHLAASLTFSSGYAHGLDVQAAGLSWLQPLVWLFSAANWNPGVIPLLLDGLFAVLGLVALPRVWRHDRLIPLWFGVTLAFLLLWPTKWPQYIVAVTVPLSIMAAQLLRDSARSLNVGRAGWWTPLRKARHRRLTASLWLLPGLVLVVGLVAYPLLIQLALSFTAVGAAAMFGGVSGLWAATWHGIVGLAPVVGFSYLGTGAFMDWLRWQQFWPMLGFNLVWVALSMLLATMLGGWLALVLLQRGLHARSMWYALFMLPWAIPEFIGALVWQTLLQTLYHHVQKAGSTPGHLALLPTNMVLAAAVVVGSWVSFPFMMIVAAGALRAIPPDLYDAARVEGASGLRLWRTVTWPLSRPVILGGVLLRGALLFNSFHIPLLLIQDIRRANVQTLALNSYLLVHDQAQLSGAAVLNSVILMLGVGVIWTYNRRGGVRQVLGDV